VRVCFDLNVWCAFVASRRKQGRLTAAGYLVDAVKRGSCARGRLALVMSWGMLERLGKVLVADIGIGRSEAGDVLAAIAGLADPAPSLTLGGVGVLRTADVEDRHVLETAWAGGADLLVTANLKDFGQTDADVRVPERIVLLRRAEQSMILAHPYAAAAWLDGRDVEGWPD
jgi:hypothetical protein